jgi:hypothetical protein
LHQIVGKGIVVIDHQHHGGRLTGSLLHNINVSMLRAARTR